MTARSLTGLILLLGVALGTWYLARPRTPSEVVAPPGSVLQDGFYLRSARMLGTDENGKLLYEVEAEFAEQRGDAEVEFKDVQIRYAPSADVPWSLIADTAIVADGRPRLRLRGHVTAVSEQGFSGEVTEIRTDYLEFEPDTFLAETDERVQIRIGARSLTATGMLALLQDNRLQLKSNVSGKFVP